MRVLMLGNSFTYFNNMPGMLAQLLEAEVVHHTRGGAHLSEHLDPETELGAKTQTALQGEKWDYVILQAYSTGPIQDKKEFLDTVQRLCKQIRENGAIPILYATWAFKQNGIKLAVSGLDYDRMYQQLYDAYHEAGVQSGAPVADVGTAFYETPEKRNLYARDDYHPNKRGSNLAAKTIAAVITELERQKGDAEEIDDLTPVPDPGDNRLRTLYVYQILRKYSDEQHAISAPEIRRILKEQYNIDVYKATLRRDIGVLRASGIEVLSDLTRTRNYYLADQTFSVPELRLLIDAVQSSKFITEQKSHDLMEKLYSLTSSVSAETLRRNIHVTGKAKSDNEKGYYIVDAIHEAMNAGRKISFLYFEYDLHKRRQLMNNGEPYTVSPYDLIWDGDYYYLTGFCDERGEVRVFRVDRINSQPTILVQEAIPKPEDYRVERYTQEVFRMFATQETAMVMLRCDQQVMKAVIDQFGMKVRTRKLDDSHFRATVKVCPGPNFYRWVFGWGGLMEIEGPEEIREEYRKLLLKELAQYDSGSGET